METTTTKGKVGRPSAPHRPVLSTRMTAESYERLTAAAKASGRTVSEEALWRIERGLEWGDAQEGAWKIREKAAEEARAILANAEHVTKETTQTQLKKELQRRGYRYVRGVNGAAWFDPGVDSITWIADPKLLEELIERIAIRAIEKLTDSKLLEELMERVAIRAIEKLAVRALKSGRE